MKKEGLSRVRKPKAFSLSCGGVVVKAVVLKAYKERESIPTLGPRLLNNLKVSWPKSERKRIRSSWEICLSMRQISLRERVEIA